MERYCEPCGTIAGSACYASPPITQGMIASVSAILATDHANAYVFDYAEWSRDIMTRYPQCATIAYMYADDSANREWLQAIIAYAVASDAERDDAISATARRMFTEIKSPE